MSARQPFFPQAPARSEARPNFTPDPTSSLHAGPKPGAEQPEQQRRQSNNPFSNRQEKPKPTTSGLGMLKKRPSGADKVALAPGPMGNNATRPGTADPYSNSRAFQPQVPLMVPTPPKATHASPSLLTQIPAPYPSSGAPTAFKVPFGSDSQNSDMNADKNAHILTQIPTPYPSSGAPTSFKVPFGSDSQNSDKNAHILTLDANQAFKAPNDDFNPQNIRFRPASRANGPQRVPIDQGPPMLNPYNKRARDTDDSGDSPPGNQAKRFKSRDQSEPLQEHDMRHKTHSPTTTDRPSSGLSHSMGRSERTSPDLHRHPVQEYQHQASPPNFKGYSQYDASMPQSSPEVRALQKLLGTDPDAYVKNHMDAYEEMINRWTNCTIEEWKAGANEIAAEYHKLLDHVKTYVDTKLKLYGSFHANVRTHNATLDERKKDLDGARKKLVQESGTVLK